MLALPHRAQAQVGIAVPNFNYAGKVDAVGNIEVDETKLWDAIQTGLVSVVLNTGISYFAKELDVKLQTLLGIKSYRQYQAALVEAKYLVESYADYFGEDTVRLNSTGQYPQNNQELAADAGRDFQAFNRTGSRDIGVNLSKSGQTAAQKQAALQKQLVRASSLFASSVVCGGIDQRAVRNMAEYMSGAAVGYTSRDLNPTQGLQFYQRLARFGAPEALPDFWVEGFKDNARQKESEARTAAALEIFSPGLKSPQTRNASGRTSINKSTSALESVLHQAVGSLFDIPASAKNSPFNTSSLGAFLTSVASQVAIMYTNQAISKALNMVPGSPGVIGNPSKFLRFIRDAASAAAGAVAAILTTRLYNQIGEMIFQGEFLAESDGCRRPTRRTPLASSGVFTAPNNLTSGQVSDDQLRQILNSEPEQVAGEIETAPQLIFYAEPTVISAGQSSLLKWDASSFGTGLTVTLSGGILTSQTISELGSVPVAPSETTTYTLTVTGPNVDQTAEVILTVNGLTAQPSVTFDPSVVESDRKVLFTWDAGVAPPGQAEVWFCDSSIASCPGQDTTGTPTSNTAQVSSINSEALSGSGSMCYTPTVADIAAGTVTINMTAVVGDSSFESTASFSVVPRPTRTFEFNVSPGVVDTESGETATLTWNVDGFTDAKVQLDGTDVPFTGSRTVGVRRYTLAVAENNNCGVIVEQTVEVIEFVPPTCGVGEIYDDASRTCVPAPPPP